MGLVQEQLCVHWRSKFLLLWPLVKVIMRAARWLLSEPDNKNHEYDKKQCADTKLCENELKLSFF